jgi:predicted dithiol-disulfide oxidoreductase (DUF899 family)
MHSYCYKAPYDRESAALSLCVVGGSPESARTSARLISSDWTRDIQDLSGRSVFYKNDAGDVFHTYSAYGRSSEEVMGIYGILDTIPKGRNETGPNHSLTDWARPRNMYGKGGEVEANGRYHAKGRA